MKKYKISQFVELLNVSTRTLRRWDNDGKLIAYRFPTGDRFYMENQVCKNIIYARVSNVRQRDDSLY